MLVASPGVGLGESGLPAGSEGAIEVPADGSETLRPWVASGEDWFWFDAQEGTAYELVARGTYTSFQGRGHVTVYSSDGALLASFMFSPIEKPVTRLYREVAGPVYVHVRMEYSSPSGYGLAIRGYQPFRLTGTVTESPTGLPVAGARVSANLAIPGFGYFLDTVSAVSSADGSYEIVVLRQGTWAVHFEDQTGHRFDEWWPSLPNPPRPTDSALHILASEGGQAVADGQLYLPATLTAVALDAVGDPVPGIEVWLSQWASDTGGTVTPTGPDGRAVFSNRDPRATTWVNTRDPNAVYTETAERLSLLGAIEKTHRLPMIVGGRIRGTVNDGSRGTPASGLLVQAYPEKDWKARASAVTAEDGTYVLSALPTGSYRIVFRDLDDWYGPYGHFWWGSSGSVEYGLVPVVAGEQTLGIDAELFDRLPPVTSSQTSSAWRRGPVEVSFTAEDQGWMGVGRTWVRYPGSTGWSEYAGPFSWAAEGEHSFGYYSEDVVAADGTTNAEDPQTLIVRIDDTRPVTGLRPDFKVMDGLPRVVELSSQDALSGVQLLRWSVDGREGSGPVVPLGGPGSRTLTYWAVDAAGNVEAPTHLTVRVAEEPVAPTRRDGMSLAGSTYRRDSGWPHASGGGLTGFSSSRMALAFDPDGDILYLSGRTWVGPVGRYAWDGEALERVHRSDRSTHVGLGVDSNRRLYVVSDTGVEVYDPQGNRLWVASSFSSKGTIRAGDVSSDGVVWFYSSRVDERSISSFRESGQWSSHSISYNVSGLAVGNSDVFVCDSSNNKVRVLSFDGAQIRDWSTGGTPSAITVDDDGYVYVSVSGNVHKYTRTGGLIESITTPESPTALAVDGVGNLFTSAADGMVRRYIHGLHAYELAIDQPRELPRYPGYLTLSGRVTPGVSGIEVRVQESVDGKTWKDAGSALTDTRGDWDHTVVLRRVTKYRALLPGDSAITGRISPSITAAPQEAVVFDVSGNDRYLTAVAGSKITFPDGAPAVVIATGEYFADALGGAALAGALESPLLLTQTKTLPAAVSGEVTRLRAKKAYILGGVNAVSPQVEATLKTRLGAGNVVRIGGVDRYDTAARVAVETIKILDSSGGYGGDAFVATGADFPDALGASPVAAIQGMPVFLADPSKSAVTLHSRVKRVWIAGGATVVSSRTETSLKSALGNGNVKRLSGHDRYETAARVAAFGVSRGMGWDGVGITTGMDFPDALAAGPVLGARGTVMLLMERDSVPAASRRALVANKQAISSIVTFGGGAAVRPEVIATVLDLVN